MILFVASSQDRDAFVWKLKIEGFRIGTKIILKKWEKLDMNVELFREYMSTILFPHIAKVRLDLRLTDEPAILLMDNCSVHMRESTLRDLAAHRVKESLSHLMLQIFSSASISVFLVFLRRELTPGCPTHPRVSPYKNGIEQRAWHRHRDETR
jgi:hypothetical protein